jgi:acyl dehydratase
MTRQEDLHFEDVVVGTEFVSEDHLVTAADIRAFADVTRDHHPLHMDEQYCRGRGFPAVIAHGLFGLSLMEGLKSEMRLYENTSVASLGWDQVRFRLPVVAGDRLRVAFRFVEKRPSRRGGRGVVTEELRLINQREEIVIEARHMALVLTRPKE